MSIKIITPTDFSKSAAQAVRQAVAIAKHTGSMLTLLHVTGFGSSTTAAAKEKLTEEAEAIRQSDGVTCDIQIKEGNILDMIAETAAEGEYDLMVTGTHGMSGILQKIFGADIVKLIARIPVPVLVVQEDSPVVEQFRKIVLPVGGHENFIKAVEASCVFSGIYDVEVHFYSINKPGFPMTAQILDNIAMTEAKLNDMGIRMIRVKEEQDDFSPGFARQTIRYAQSVGADAICIMAVASEDHYFMSKAYKEAVLLNEERLPILCAGGGR